MHQTDQLKAVPKQAAAGPSSIELELGDGSRLVLEDASASPIIRRIEADRVCLADTLLGEGEPFAGYRRLR